jgi:hypothetical protein
VCIARDAGAAREEDAVVAGGGGHRGEASFGEQGFLAAAGVPFADLGDRTGARRTQIHALAAVMPASFATCSQTSFGGHTTPAQSSTHVGAVAPSAQAKSVGLLLAAVADAAAEVVERRTLHRAHAGVARVSIQSVVVLFAESAAPVARHGERPSPWHGLPFLRRQAVALPQAAAISQSLSVTLNLP